MDTYKPYIDYAIWAIIVLVVLVIAMVLWKAFNRRVRGRRGQRLGIAEYHELDQSRRLVLVRRDNVEHLLLIGGPADVVVESGIVRSTGGIAQPAAAEPPEEPQMRPAAVRLAPRAPGFGAPRPTPVRQEPPLRDPEA